MSALSQFADQQPSNPIMHVVFCHSVVKHGVPRHDPVCCLGQHLLIASCLMRHAPHPAPCLLFLTCFWQSTSGSLVLIPRLFLTTFWSLGPSSALGLNSLPPFLAAFCQDLLTLCHHCVRQCFTMFTPVSNMPPSVAVLQVTIAATVSKCSPSIN